jgi:predicted lipoprotein with Yx(FWY)xxD motif
MRKSLALLPALVLLLAACSSSGATQSPSAAAAAPSVAASVAAPSTAASAGGSAAAPSAGAAALKVADSSLGKIVVDGQGRTLYMFTPDEGGTPTCYDKCAASWPALMASGDVQADPAVTGEVTSVDRTDGGKQVKLGEYPLYYFANDKAPGDTNGQGVGTKWYVVDPSGEPIKK